MAVALACAARIARRHVPHTGGPTGQRVEDLPSALPDLSILASELFVISRRRQPLGHPRWEPATGRPDMRYGQPFLLHLW